ncbi:prorelaxin H1 [Pholidichthys leucotaenia]
MLLSVAMVTVFAVLGVSAVHGDPLNHLAAPRDYGMKLCGREFIRAVIFTCGGSRWRRSADDPDLFPWRSIGDENLQDFQHLWQLPPPRQSSSPLSLSDLLNLYQYGTEVAASAAGVGENGGSDDKQILVLNNKRKRNFSAGVAGMCCNQGCTKNDIGRLC